MTFVENPQKLGPISPYSTSILNNTVDAISIHISLTCKCLFLLFKPSIKKLIKWIFQKKNIAFPTRQVQLFLMIIIIATWLFSWYNLFYIAQKSLPLSKCFENVIKIIKISFINKEKDVIACSCFHKINKVYKKKCKNLLIMFFFKTFLYKYIS